MKKGETPKPKTSVVYLDKTNTYSADVEWVEGRTLLVKSSIDDGLGIKYDIAVYRNGEFEVFGTGGIGIRALVKRDILGVFPFDWPTEKNRSG